MNSIWDVVNGECRHTLHGHTNGVHSVVWSPDGKTVVSGSDDGTIKFWNVVNGGCTHIVSGHTRGVCSVALSPDGKTVASGSWDSTIKLWDIITSYQEYLEQLIKEEQQKNSGLK